MKTRIGSSARSFMFVTIVFFLFAATAWAQVTFESLLQEITDRDAVAQWPDPAYTCRQFSSYDQASKEPGTSDWWANDDRDQFVRVENNGGRTEYVLMDTQGPGAIVRFWTTWHGKGRESGGGTEPFSDGPIRIYLDGSSTPTIEAPATELIGGSHLVGAPLSESVSPLTDARWRGHNLYLPMPYSRSCKVTYESNTFVDTRTGEVLYYQINYRTYEPGTTVTTFRPDDLKDHAGLIKKTQSILQQSKIPTRGQSQPFDAVLEPQESTSLTLTGPQAIRSLSLKLDATDIHQAFRSTIVQIEFDGKQTVWCPVGDFFATGYKLSPYFTWFTRAEEDGVLACAWPMPFQKQATVTFVNLGDQPVAIRNGNVTSSHWKWDDRSLYFHAAWKLWHQIQTKNNPVHREQGAFDLHWVGIEGRGKYLGDALSIFNRGRAWWGEGDEKIYVDGETFPSHFGTGTEDYYGYAWCRPEAFSSPFHAQPTGQGNLEPGFSENVRFRPLDSIPFTRSLRFDLELWHWAKTTVDYAPTTFWYADGDSTCDVAPAPEQAKLRVTVDPPPRVQKRVQGAIEGESLHVWKTDGGTTQVQSSEAFGWSYDRQLWWMDAAPGQTLSLDFPSDQEGRFAVYAGLTKARDYGIVGISVNGQVLQESLDLYNPEVLSTELFVGICNVKKGANRFEVTVKGANPEAEKRHMFGLDYLKLITPSVHNNGQ